MPSHPRPWSPDRVWELALRPIGLASAAARAALRTFAAWLVKDRGLAPPTVRMHLYCLGQFLSDVARGTSTRTALRRLTPAAIEDFVVGYARVHTQRMQQHMRSALRSFFRLAGDRRWAQHGLAQAVPGFRQYRLAGIPRAIPEDRIRALLAAIPRAGVRACRDRALLLLLATFGARAGQVCALRLDDVAWKDRRIRFRPHKGGKEVVHQIPDVVGDSLARYLRDARPTSERPEIFLRLRRPFHPLSPSALGTMIRDRLKAAGLPLSPGGTHGFRHAFAVRLLATGHSVKTIADLLGHHDLDSTAIYAKVDRRALATLAPPWPEVLR